MATAVALLFPRGRPGAPVSMPLVRSQVKRGLDPAKFTVRTAPAQLARLNPWETYCASERRLAEAIRRLGVRAHLSATSHAIRISSNNFCNFLNQFYVKILLFGRQKLLYVIFSFYLHGLIFSVNFA